MPLNPAQCAAQVIAAMDQADPTDRVALFTKLFEGLFAHIQANAIVTFAAAPATGLSSPPGGGPVSGALTVTGGAIT